MRKTDEFYDVLWTQHLPKIEKQIEFLNKLIGRDNIENKIVLDAGCGTGIAAISFKKLGANKVIGIDISKKSLLTAKKLAEEAGVKLKFITGDLLNLPLKGNFDIIHSFGALHHTGDTKGAFANLINLLGENGQFYLALYWRTRLTFLHQFIRKILRLLPESAWEPISKFITKFMVGKKKTQRGFDGYGEALDWLCVPHRDHYRPEEIKKWFKEYNMQSELLVKQTGRFKSTSNFVIRGFKVQDKKTFYNNLWLNQWQRVVEFGPGTQARYRLIAEIIRKYELSGSLLDVGCGLGQLLSKIRKDFPDRFSKFCGMDFSEEAIKAISNKGVADDLFIGDIRNQNTFKGKSFDVVICSEVLEHIADYKKATANLSQLVRPQGHLVITVPYSAKYWTRHDDFSGHIRRFEKRQIENELEGCKFTILESFVWGAFFYNLYYKLLARAKPQELMSSKNILIKKIASSILQHLFTIDDLLIRTRKGRRLFIVAKK